MTAAPADSAACPCGHAADRHGPEAGGCIECRCTVTAAPTADVCACGHDVTDHGNGPVGCIHRDGCDGFRAGPTGPDPQRCPRCGGAPRNVHGTSIVACTDCGRYLQQQRFAAAPTGPEPRTDAAVGR